jgi:hypothetical protein
MCELRDRLLGGYEFTCRFFWDLSFLAQQTKKMNQCPCVPISDTATLTDVAADVIIRYIFCGLAAFLEPVTEMIDDSKMVTNAPAGVAIFEKIIRNELHVWSHRTRAKTFRRPWVFEESLHRASCQDSVSRKTLA